MNDKNHSIVKAQRDDKEKMKRDIYGKVLKKRENVEFLSRWLKKTLL